jgi:hypothetical protein
MLLRFDLNGTEGPRVRIRAIIPDLTSAGDHATILLSLKVRKQPTPIHQLAFAQFERTFPDETPGAGIVLARVATQRSIVRSRQCHGTGRAENARRRSLIAFPTSLLCDLPTVQQAAVGDGPSFDPFPFDHDGLAPPEVDAGGRQVGDATRMSQVM